MSAEDLPEQMRVRRDKLARLRAVGVDPYPPEFTRTTSLGALRDRFPDLDPDQTTGALVAVAGRVLLNRPSGRITFATLREGATDLQIMLTAGRTGTEALMAWQRDIDLGDQVGVAGEVVTSRRGELSVLVDRWVLTAKALRPLPEKHRGLADPETRVRQRYVDLIVNPDARRLLEARAIVLGSLRSTLRGQGYLEVETPILQPLHGGAAARPFATHINAFDVPLYLRIAIELYLKRLIVGGVEKVFEIGRTFRNEGVDATHSPEFTMVEAYQAYGDYDTMAELTQALVVDAATAVGSTLVPDGRGGHVDLTGTWRHVTLYDAVSAAVGEELTAETPPSVLRRQAARCGVALQPDWDAGEIALELYEKLVEHTLLAPTIVRDYPVAVRPLARPHRNDPRLAEAWDLVIAGRELAVAYSELADPVEQRHRLHEQSLQAAGGNPEAMQLDEDFLRALEYGMPPTGGMGMGIDRLLMLLTDTSTIRETISFPLVRPE